MKTRAYRIVAIMSAITMLSVISTGCKNGSDEVDDLSDTVYIAQSILTPSDIGGISALAYYNEKIYVATTVYKYENDENQFLTTADVKIYSMNIDGTELDSLVGYTPPSTAVEDVCESVSIIDMFFDDAGFLWIVERWRFYKYDLHDGFDIERDDPSEYEVTINEGTNIRKLDTSGNELVSLNMGNFSGLTSTQHISAVTVDNSSGEEIIYLGYWEPIAQSMAIFVTDSSSNIQFRLDADNNFDRFISLPDGTMAFPAIPVFDIMSSAQAIQTIDFEAKAFGEIINLSDVGMYVYNDGNTFDMLISNGNDVYGYTISEQSAVWLFNRFECGISGGSLEIIGTIDDGSIICATTMFNYSTGKSNTDIFILSKALRSELPDKTVLTLVTLIELPSHYLDAIAAFNSSNQHYSIDVNAYSDFSNITNGLSRLNTEIISGTIPDILYTSVIPFEDYTRNGLFADLYPFIEADAEFDYTDFIEEAIRSAETDGKLYRNISDFSVRTIVGNSSIVGADMGWTIEDFISVLDDNPEADIPLGSFYEKEAFLTAVVMNCIDDFVNWETGTASFNTLEFIQLLELSDRVAENTQQEQTVGDTTFVIIGNPAEDISSGRQIMWETSVSDFGIQRYRDMFDGDIAFKGWPNENKNGNTIEVGHGFAITEQSPNKGAAWLFLRTLFDADWQLKNISNGNIYGFPVNRAAFDQLIINSLEPDSQTQDGFKITETDIGAVISLIHSASPSRVSGFDDAFYNILREGAYDYWSGVCGAQEAAEIIQSRMSLYVSERS